MSCTASQNQTGNETKEMTRYPKQTGDDLFIKRRFLTKDREKNTTTSRKGKVLLKGCPIHKAGGLRRRRGCGDFPLTEKKLGP